MKSGWDSSSLAGGRFLESGSRHRNIRSLIAGGKFSGIGGESLAEAIYNKYDTMLIMNF